MCESESSSPKLLEVVGRASTDSLYTVHWSDGHSSRYPFVWLLDNCQCPECYHSTSHHRRFRMRNLDPEIRPIKEEISPDGVFLKITWPNGHVGEYSSAWIRQQQFDKGHYDPILPIKPRPWGCELANGITRFKYEDVMDNDDVLFTWLYALSEVGFALITNAPPGAVEAISNRVAFPRQTIFGKTFHLRNIREDDSPFFSISELAAHVDVPCEYYTPGVMMLHTIQQTMSNGGGNQFFDACYATRILKQRNTKFYELLKTTDISFRIWGYGSNDCEDYHYISTRPIIEEDNEGNLKRVNYSNHMRTPDMNLPVEKVQDVYRAIKLFDDILYENKIELKLKAGEMATINNWRVMHSRVGYKRDSRLKDDEADRYIEGGYLEWDHVNSRLRVLKGKMDGKLNHE